MAKPQVTGKMHTRIVGKSRAPGREETHDLVSVVAILSVPKGTFRDDGMVVVFGSPEVLTTMDVGETRDSTGMNHGSLLTEPIWQV